MKKIIIFPIFLNLFFCHIFLFSAEIIPHPQNKPASCCIAISCVFQHEAAWLKEWIEFHLLIGVEHFYLYNNLSNDDYLPVLLPYIKKGIVELFEYPQEQFKRCHQIFVYEHSLMIARKHNVKWLALIDADEFITPIQDNHLASILKAYEDYPGVSLKWLIYGTSNIEHLGPDKLMIEKLNMRLPKGHQANKFRKNIVQPHLTSHCVNPHLCHYINDGNASLMPISVMRLNHYYFRSRNYTDTIKIPRLRSRRKNGVGNICTAGSIMQLEAEANQIKDDTMERFVIPLKKRVFGSTH